MFSGTLPTLADLKAIEPSARRPGTVYFVLDAGPGQLGGCYLYNVNLSGAEVGTVVVRPNFGGGLWVRMGSAVHVDTVRPNVIPPIRGVLWAARLSDPTRIVFYESRGTASIADWVVCGQAPFLRPASPAGVIVPDFQTQKVLIDSSGTPAEWISFGAGINDWVQVGGSTGGGGGSE